MTVRVRFAPSPTGYLHIGGARTALYNYLFAKAQGGTYVLRIEDTDLERSKREYEEVQIKSLKWLGIDHDEGPDCPGKYGPYRQSERIPLYKKYSDLLIEKGKAYYCFCTEEELEAKKEVANKEGRPPHYDGKCRNLTLEEANNRLAAGVKGSVRFKAPHKAYVFTDHVRGRVVFPEGMVGDFVIMRSNGLPVYNYCCVVDDWLMEISHVIRAEEHLPNTLRQLMLYEALEAKHPEFAHVSLLVGSDRQKLSKRHGATSVSQYHEEGYLPEAMCNYLCLLGWSHPEEKDIFTKSELKGVFTIDRFQKSAAMYDVEKLKWVNGQHLKQLPLEILEKNVKAVLEPSSLFHSQNEEWRLRCIDLLRTQAHFYQDFAPLISEIFSGVIEDNEKMAEINAWETTPAIRDYLRAEILKLIEAKRQFADETDLARWTEHVKGQIKAKGKPLFMGMRAVLTGRDHGPELKFLIPLTPLDVLKKRVGE